MSDISTSVQNKNNTLKNTLRCVLVLTVIAVVCVAILAVANRFMQPEEKLDAQTSALINKIAPTGESDSDAYNNGSIKLVDLSKGNYKVTDLDAYNKSYGTVNKKVRALYSSRNKSTNKTTLVVEAESKGHVGPVVVLVAYDDDGTITGVTVKSQNESYWDHVNEEKMYAAIVGNKGQISASSDMTAASTGASHTRGAIIDAVNLASDFFVRLGSDVKEQPEEVTSASEKAILARVSDATSFMRYPMQEGKTAYLGDNGDLVVKASGGESTTYGQITVYVLIKDGAVVKVAYGENSFSPMGSYDSDKLLSDTTLTELFAGATVTSLTGQSGKLPGITGATESSNGVREAVLSALRYAATFDAGAWEE
ncbi:MAG: FMN-binding protein [Clostridiales bacterium]|nr:FMN-binding protein [Clostridiales bacterium]